MATKRKKEELLLKSLRELTALSHNKKCLECQERGPTYADMTTHGFVCTSCSGYLRGLNPPHRVKSISMTTFTEQELGLLKNGGNELAHAVWMGRWNPRHDKEPSKKEEVAFKEFLIAKYERRQWYRDPGEIKKEKEQESNAPAPEPKLLPPPSVKKSAGTVASSAVQPPSSVPASQTSAAVPTPTISSNPAPTTIPTATAAAVASGTQKPDLLGGLESDPFAPKGPPPGAVAVFPPGGVPLFNSTKEVLKPGSGTSQPTSSATAISEGDKYAALASLDVTLKELRVKEEPSPQPAQSQNHQIQGQGNVFVGGAGGGGSNPFGAPSTGGTQAPPGQQFNPFAVPQSQPVTGGMRPVGPGYGAYQGAPGGMSGGMGMMPGQQFQPQQFGGFGQPNQFMGPQMQAMGQPIQQMGQRPPIQQMGQRPPIQQMGQPVNQWQQSAGQQWGQPQQQAFQAQQMMQGQWRPQQVVQQPAMQQQQMFGGMMPGSVQGGVVSQNVRGFGNMGVPQAQQQGGGHGGFNWGTSVSSTPQTPPSSSSTATGVGLQTSAASSVGMGWSTDLSKQMPASSGWGGTSVSNVSATPTGWSASLQTAPAGSVGGWGGRSAGGANVGGWGGTVGVSSAGGGNVGGWGGTVGVSSTGGGNVGGWGGTVGVSSAGGGNVGGWGGVGVSSAGGGNVGGWGGMVGVSSAGGGNVGGWGGMVGASSPQQQAQQPGNWGVAASQPSNPFMTSPQTSKNPFL